MRKTSYNERQVAVCREESVLYATRSWEQEAFVPYVSDGSGIWCTWPDGYLQRQTTADFVESLIFMEQRMKKKFCGMV